MNTSLGSDMSFSNSRPEYVDIHGHNIHVLNSEKHGILVPLSELTRRGFRVYLKNQFNKLLVDEKDFDEAFNLHMLNCAEQYMLENKILFNEEKIVETIRRARESLLIRSPNSKSTSFNGRIIHETDDNLTIKINANTNSDKSPQQLTKQNLNLHNKKFDSPPAKNNFKSASSSIPNFKQNIPTNNNVEINEKPRNIESGKNYSNNLRLPKCGPSLGRSQNGSVKSNSELGERKRPMLSTATILENEIHEVSISYIEEKPGVMWVQPMANTETLLNIYEKINNEVEKATPTKPMLGKLFAAQCSDGTWCRCKVINNDPLKGFFIDYGNQEIIPRVMPISDELAHIPPQAVRVCFTVGTLVPKVEDEIKIKPERRYEDGTYYAQIVSSSHSSPPKDINTSCNLKQSSDSTMNKQKPTLNIEEKEFENSFFGIPKPRDDLQNGTEVKIIGEVDGRLIVMTQNCYKSLKEMNENLKNLKPVPLKNLKTGQLILTIKNKEIGLCRASILSIDGNSLNVQFIDYGERSVISRDSALAISKELSEEPINCIEISTLQGFNGKFSDDERKLINQWINGNIKFSVVKENNSYDLKFVCGMFASKKLKELTEVKRNYLTPNDFEKVSLPLGSQNVIVSCYIDMDHIIIMPGDDMNHYIDDIIKTHMIDTKPYSPSVGEMCFGCYEDNWYRCVIEEKIGNFEYRGRLIDFGNVCSLKAEHIRKLPEDAVKVPILGATCKLVGISKSSNVDSKLRAELEDGSAWEIVVQKCVNGIYEIEIPSVYKMINGN